MKRMSIAIAFSLTAAAALAHSGATGIVKERMEHMKSIGEATKAIGEMIKGEVDYEAEKVREHAEAIAKSGGEEITKLFPEHSMMGPSEARHEIWTNWERFTEISEDLSVAAKALAEGAGNDRDGSDSSPDVLFREIAGTCKACHQDFRAKK